MDINSVLKTICGRVLVGYLLKFPVKKCINYHLLLIEDLWTGLRMEETDLGLNRSYHINVFKNTVFGYNTIFYLFVPLKYGVINIMVQCVGRTY